MKIYVYDFTAEGMGVSDSEGNRIGLCCYDDESAGTTKTYGYFDHTDMSLFGCEMHDRGGPSPVPFFAGASEASSGHSISFDDLLISGDDMLDLYEDMEGF